MAHSATILLGTHLNATTRWKDVPEAVWNYTLGGYQVLKKWLSYREAIRELQPKRQIRDLAARVLRRLNPLNLEPREKA